MQLRKSDLPDDFWALRRIERNRRRSQRNKQRKREKAAELSFRETEEQRHARHQAAREAGRLLQRRLEDGMKHGLRVVVDCSFASSSEASNQRELRSLARQLQFCISANKTAPKAACLIFAGFLGPLREYAMSRWNAGSWKVHLREESADQILKEERKVVVLSPDAHKPLETVEPDTAYVVGGIVDRTVQKGITQFFADGSGWTARRLPLREHVDVQNPVLTVNNVVTALLKVHGGQTWKEALGEVVPARKKKNLGS